MKRVMAAAALVGAASIGLSSSAVASSLVTVSGPSPYANCSNAGQKGTNYANTVEEPSRA